MPVSINGNTGVITGLAVGGLPDGTVDADTLASNAVTAGKLASGVGGKVLQVVTASTSSTVSSSSGSFVDSGLTANITPQSSSNKVLVLIDSPFHVSRSGSTTTFDIKILRDSHEVFAGGATNSDYQQGIGGSISSNVICGMVSKMILDSPSSTSSLTYKLQGRSGYNATIAFQSGSVSHITLIEVGA